jgi:hypothetical protein
MIITTAFAEELNHRATHSMLLVTNYTLPFTPQRSTTHHKSISLYTEALCNKYLCYVDNLSPLISDRKLYDRR